MAGRTPCATPWPVGWSTAGLDQEVADVLRHRSLNTSLIYAKTDRAGLAEVALPLARESSMSAHIPSRADRDVSGRAPSPRVRTSAHGSGARRFARYVEAVGHHGPLTVEVMAAWARQVKGGRGDRARRLAPTSVQAVYALAAAVRAGYRGPRRGDLRRSRVGAPRTSSATRRSRPCSKPLATRAATAQYRHADLVPD